jgi:hypothetical protein
MGGRTIRIFGDICTSAMAEKTTKRMTMDPSLALTVIIRQVSGYTNVHSISRSGRFISIFCEQCMRGKMMERKDTG